MTGSTGAAGFQRFKRQLISTVTYSLTGALIALPLIAGPVLAQTRDSLTIGISQYPSNFHPLIDSTAARSYVLGFAQRPITAYNADWELECLLCEEIPSLENGLARYEPREDGTQGIAATFTIQEGAVWGDGTPITVDDVLFTWELGKHPEGGVANFEFFRRDIVDISTEGERTFTLHYREPACEFAAINGFHVLPAHLEAERFREDPKAYAQRTAYDTDTTNPGLYWGPYRIERVEPGSAVVLTQNENWWGAEPAFERIIVRTITNTAAMGANLLAGQVDFLTGEIGMSIEQALSLEQRAGENFTFVYQPGLIYEHIDVNLDNPQLADKRVRQALLYALDREQINEQLFGGRQPVAATNVNPLDSVYFADVKTYGFDPGRAATLLEQAGWSLQRGQRRNSNGEVLSVELMTTAGNSTRELVQQVLQQQWQALGIEVSLRNQPARIFFGQTVKQREFEDLAMFAWISSPRSIPRTTLHSSMIPTPENNWGGQNSTGYTNPEVDRIIDDLITTCEPEANQALWNRLQEIYAEDLPALPLYFRANSYVMPAWLDGVRPTGHQHPTSLWVETWGVR